MSEIMTRDQQRVEDTWNMQDMYATEELFSEDAELLEKCIEELQGMQGTLKQGAQQLLKALKLYAKASEIYEKLYVYANQKYHENTANAKYQQMSGEMQIIGTRLSQAVSWMEPELLAIPQEVLEGYFSADAADQKGSQTDNVEARELAKFRRFVEQITRKRDHVLDAQTEALMARVGELGQAPSNIYSMFNNADVRFPDVAGEDGQTVAMTAGTFISHMQSRDRTLRKNAFEGLYSVYEQFILSLIHI